MNAPIIVILGPTASGKTKLAVQWARQLNAEIISADSRQVFKGMDIGTGKDLNEYTNDGQSIKHHLIDIIAAGDDYNVHQFLQDFWHAYHQINDRQKRVILCGGSGMYLQAVLQNFEFAAVPMNEYLREKLSKNTDDELVDIFTHRPSIYSAKADVSTRKRLIRAIEIGDFLQHNPVPKPYQRPEDVSFEVFGIDVLPQTRRERISLRLHERLQNGLIEEVQALIKQGVSPEKLIFYGLEYKFVAQYLTGELDYPTMVERLETAIHQFAKRQMTFFRSMQRNGVPINWISPTDDYLTLTTSTSKSSGA